MNISKGFVNELLNKHSRKPKGQSIMDNPVTMATLGTVRRQNKKHNTEN
jgi:hypothetical protein